MDLVSLIGASVALISIALGHLLDGGHLGSILQLTAAVIVLGGTAGATMLSVPSADLMGAGRMLREVFIRSRRSHSEILERFTAMAALARKDGIVSLEEEVQELPDPFLRRAICHVVDGTDAQALREILETDLEVRMEERGAAARVFDTAGGYAPTIGILGAVLGLIHAMETLDEPSRLGQGIAVAFVSTIYGVGLANLFLFPIATKLQRLTGRQRLHDEMIIEGCLALQSGQHPGSVRARLRAFLSGRGEGGAESR